MFALKEKQDSMVDNLIMKAEWSFVALGLFGELFARNNGPQQILKSCADLLAIMMKVRFLSPNPL